MGYVVILVQTYCTEDNSCIFSSSTPTCVLTSNPPVASFHFSSACDPFFSFSSFIAWLNKSLKHSKPWHEVAAVTAAVSRGAIPLSFFLVADTPRRRSLDALRSSNVAPVVCSWASNSSTVKVKSPVTYHADINSRSEPTHAATISSEDSTYGRATAADVVVEQYIHGDHCTALPHVRFWAHATMLELVSVIAHVLGFLGSCYFVHLIHVHGLKLHAVNLSIAEWRPVTSAPTQQLLLLCVC